jgi:hypothetical protein
MPTRRTSAYANAETLPKERIVQPPVLGENGQIGRLPGVLKQQFNAREGLSKALMHDLDARFENQDRMINYLMQQLNSFESLVSNSNKRVSDL